MPKMSVLSKKGVKRATNPWLWNHSSEKLGKPLILTTICTLSLVCIVNKTLKPNRNFKMSIIFQKRALSAQNRVQKVLIMSPQKRQKRHMLSSKSYTQTSFQRCLFENILAIYIKCTKTYYKHNTNFCCTVIIIKNNLKYQNSCYVIGSSESVSWVLMILQHSHCLDCLDYYIVFFAFTEIASFHFVYPADAYCISSTFATLARKWKISGFVPPSTIFGT